MKNVGNRLEALKSRLTLNWGELAQHIGISRAMMDFVRTGAREPSPKLLRKIAAAELAAGLSAPAEPPAAVFQTLEKQAPDFPNLGKTGEDFSKPWKNAPDYFQALEKRLDRLEAKIDDLLRRR